MRVRRVCERRLCETVDVETVATTLTLAEQNHAEELKKVCLEYVSKNLAAVINTDGYRHMTRSCPQLQAEILQTIAATGTQHHTSDRHRQHATRTREHVAEEDARRVRPRRE